ncbi:hypothetical protein [Truepera radiovictrix]|uniref:Uncharacterized protein n=1 Tax=Truepera radiovictrix (strain DSM 17093 / CIP 108686 / LMG 22925 / RQ-24) TaxID=649638 RepID=D7CTB5_TRURR|nr:hypothetical protein [Truepera radiovictrix]ADI15578.1 hypothetical protein Trad_2470 [Truepera radiovictrix DSM 17093]WMT58793.1 hypothetical protein RCV51_07570 [Truepera radiovictrix]
MLSDLSAAVIAIDGTMNPTIHHPTWYQLIGLLSWEDTAFATAGRHLLVTPSVSTFRVPAFALRCKRERWEIRTVSREARTRILNVALKTFDDLLPQTPVTGFHFTFRFSIEVPHERAADFFGGALREVAPIEGRGERVLMMSTVTVDDTKRRLFQVRLLPEGNQLLVKHRFSYAVRAKGMYTLRQMSMSEDYDLDYEEAVTRTEQLAAKLTHKGSRRSGGNTISN